MSGYATGGALVAFLSPAVTLLVSATLYATAALCSYTGLTRRAPRASGRPSVAGTWRTNALLWSSVPRRRLYLGLWIPNGLVVGCESLFVAYAPDRAGLLFACAALGMLTGDITWWQYVAGAGDDLASYCLYLQHLVLGDAEAAAWWRDQTNIATRPAPEPLMAIPAPGIPTAYDASFPTVLRALTRLDRTVPRTELVDAVMHYVPGAVALGYLDNPDFELPLPGPTSPPTSPPS